MERILDAKSKRNKKVCIYQMADDSSFYETEEFIKQQKAIVALINNTTGWQYERMYLDVDGNHNEFRKMIEDCRVGKIDVIVTKTILRFAGTLKDTLKVAKELVEMKPAIEIVFVDEAVYSTDEEKMSVIMELIKDGESAAGNVFGDCSAEEYFSTQYKKYIQAGR